MAINYLANMDRWTGFPFLIEKFNLKIGIEIGVREGIFSAHLLQNTNLDILYGLDRDPDWNGMKNRGLIDNPRYKFITGHTPKYASNFEDDFFDFIHIDAWHTREACYADLVAWWPKLKKGGLFCGDDYLLAHSHPESKFGVVEAVEQWSKENNIEYFVTGCENIDFESKFKYSLDMWKLLENRIHESHKGFQIPQWWTIKL